MNIFFRVDSSSKIGGGHIFRCLTLASELKKNGNAISFICEEKKGNLAQSVIERGFSLYMLPSDKNYWSNKNFIKSNNYADWLSVSELDDANRSIEVIKKKKENVDWMIVDHYALNTKWEEALSHHVGNLMVIEDLYERKHKCSILLNQNLYAERDDKYKNLVPIGCRQLLGLKYAMLDPVYHNLRTNFLYKSDEIKNILVYFGGADQENLTGRSLDVFINMNRSDIKVNVVIPNSHPNVSEIEKIILGHNNIVLHKGYIELASLMVLADLAIGAGGATNWERFCLGIPSIIVAMSKNQIPTAKVLEKEGLVEFIGYGGNDFSERLRECLAKVFKMNKYFEWSQKCKQFVDGKGVYRVAETLK